MKKILLSAVLILLTSFVFSQGSGGSPKFTNDIPICQNASLNERNVRMTVAFNGWIYAAYSSPDVDNNKSIQIKCSKDNGISWNPFYTYALSNIDYSNFDIVATGNDTSSLSLFLAASYITNGGNTNAFFINRHKGTYPDLVENNYSLMASGKIMGIAIASDYQLPSTVSTPFSVGAIYSMRGSMDSINYVVSTDGGTSFNYTYSIAQTSSYYRKVSLSYGRSTFASNGRFFAAWEQIGTYDENSTGHIYTSRNQTYLNDVWIPQVNLDSIYPSSIGLCKNPTIATQFNDIDNDSTNVSALVAFERDYLGAGNDHDILGFYNMTASYSNYWNILGINNTSNNCIQPHISYDPAGNHFLAVYFDSTAKKLPYLVNGMNFNLTGPDAWLQITDKYNDDTNMVSPSPRVQINPVFGNTAHVWIAEDLNNFGIAMFDAEYLQTGINEEPKSIFSNEVIYPNPVSETATISFNMETSSDATIQIVDITGKIILDKEITDINVGKGIEKIDVKGWDNGVYFFSISSNKEKITSRFVVAH